MKRVHEVSNDYHNKDANHSPLHGLCNWYMSYQVNLEQRMDR